MRKFFTVFAAVLVTTNVMAELRRNADIKGDLSTYAYYYVVPTAAMTSSSGTYGTAYGVYGGATKTIVPSDVIGGYLMKCGYDVLPSIVPENADKTIIVSYASTGRRQLSTFSYASGIIIQMRNAQTQELVATFEAEGCGSDETEDIYQAIYNAFNFYQYTMHPAVIVDVVSVNKNYIILTCTNKTPAPIKNIDLKISYTLDGEVMHVQYANINSWVVNIDDYIRETITRDKEARNKKYDVHVELLHYE